MGIFRSYAGFGTTSSDGSFMDNRAFVHLLRDIGLFTEKRYSTAAADIIFNKVKTKGERKISFDQFMQGLLLVSNELSIDFEPLIMRVMELEGPTVTGTIPEAVRLHDNRATYTGVYKQPGGPSANDLSTSDLKHFINRDVQADVRGAPKAHELPAINEVQQAMPPILEASGAPSPVARRAVDRPGSARSGTAGSPLRVSGDASASSSSPAARSPGAFARQAQAGNSRSVKIPADTPYLSELYMLFTSYNTFGGGQKDPMLMDSGAFSKIFKDRDANKRFPVNHLDIVFASVKEVGKVKINFQQFVEALRILATQYFNAPFEELASILVTSGGPVVNATRPDYVPLYDGPRVASAKGPSPSGSRPGSALRRQGSSGTNSDRAEDADTVSTSSSEMKALREVFRQYCGFGGNADYDSMDGRTFVKLCREKGLLSAKCGANDCDLIFAAVKQKGLKKISFRDFLRALEKVMAKDPAFYGSDLMELARHVTGSGGPTTNGSTKAEAVPLHDDRRNYTGVYKNGGPSANDTQTADLRNFINRDVHADIRGAPPKP